MAFTNANLSLRPGAPGDYTYKYDAGSDTMATVAAAGYFNNTDDNLNLVVDDLIKCDCSDGNMVLKVASISSGAVTCQHAGGNLPIATHATGTDATIANPITTSFFMEVGTSIATATRHILPTPYAGAEVIVRRIDSGTQAIEFDAGGSGATAIVYNNQNDRRITTRYEGEGFHVVGSSTTRWRLYNMQFRSSGSEDLGGGASAFISGT